VNKLISKSSSGSVKTGASALIKAWKNVSSYAEQMSTSTASNWRNKLIVSISDGSTSNVLFIYNGTISVSGFEYRAYTSMSDRLIDEIG
jgi:hypothetical protein